MNNIYQVNKDFDFSKLTLANPNGLQGGAYFTKLRMNNGPLYVQMPRSYTKQGIVKTEKKIYSDLLFNQDDNNVIEWLVALEERVQEIIYEKRQLWFQQDLELDDIQTAFNTSVRSYKGNKYLVRTNIITPKHINYKPNIQIFDEDEKAKSVEEVTSDKPIISIIEVAGVKFTSRNFQLDIYLKQIMMLDDKPLFNSCLIKKGESEVKQENTKIPMLKKSDMSSVEINESDSDNSSESDVVSKSSVNTGNETVTVETLKPEQQNKVENEDSVVMENSEEALGETDVETVGGADVETVGGADVETVGGTEEETVGGADVETTAETSEETQDEHQKPVLVMESSEDDKQDNDDLEKVQESNNTDDIELMKEVEIGDYKDLGNNDTISLKKPNDVYIEIYREAKEKAKRARIMAIKAYLEAKKVKKTYLLDNYIDSDSDDDSSLFGSLDEETLTNEIEELNGNYTNELESEVA